MNRYIRFSVRVMVCFCQVMVLVAGGGYAEYVAVHMGTVMKIPEGISMIDAAG
jgi:NADPH:quinone reductase-like Zn-dependent oxidoreductase